MTFNDNYADNSLSRGIRSVANDYDAACKRLLSDKQVLAHILRGSLREYEHVNPRVIERKYLEGSPRIGSEPVGRDEFAASRVRALESKDSTVAEGEVTFDIRFEAIVPGRNDHVLLELDLEAQNDFDPGYPLLRRGMYYAGRLLSMQGSEVAAHSQYQNVRKAVSIWVCTHPSEKCRRTITRFHVFRDDVIGHGEYCKDDWDMIEVVMICLDDKTEEQPDGLLGLLGTLLAVGRPVEDRIRDLRDRYGMIVTESLCRKVNDMCNLSVGVYAEGYARGEERGLAHSVVSIMETLSCDFDHALEILKVPPQKRAQILNLIDQS